MRRLRGILVALLILAATAAVGWWRHQPERVPEQSTVHSASGVVAADEIQRQPEVATVSPARSTAAVAAASSVVHAAEAPRLPAGSWHDIRPQLEALARAGDARAARRLADIYQYCAGWKDKVARMKKDMEAQEAARQPAAPASVPKHMAGFHSYLRRQIDQLRSRCGELGPVATTDRWRHYRRSLHQAAANGSTAAMLAYAHYAVRSVGFPDRPNEPFKTPPLAQAETIADTREQAIGFLQHAATLGDSAALLEQAYQYHDGSLFPLDQVRGYAFYLAWQSLAGRAMDFTPSSSAYWAQVEQRLAETQVQEAHKLARGIRRRFQPAAGAER